MNKTKKNLPELLGYIIGISVAVVAVAVVVALGIKFIMWIFGW
jgi:hypothetical protein